jgi:ATP-binding cassette subfamily B protein
VCRVEAATYDTDAFPNRQEAAKVGVTRITMMVQDAQRFMSALIRMVVAAGVITALHGLPLLLLAVPPAGTGAVLSARVNYETPNASTPAP